MLSVSEELNGRNNNLAALARGIRQLDGAIATKPRLDRGITVGLAYPVQRVLRANRENRIPVLMYHGIAEKLSDRHPYFETSTSPAIFERHISFLADRGYHSLGLSEAVARESVSKRSVVITFDDGYRDFYTHAFPVLRKYGFKATVFVVSSFAGQQRIKMSDPEYMTWEEVRTVHCHGIDIGSHTVTHPQLDEMNPSEVRGELSISKKEIEDKIGAPVESFAYPYAFPEQDAVFVAMLREFLQAEGYKIGVSTVIGTARLGSDPFFLPRIPVNSHDDLRFLEAKLNGGYDWLHPIQYAYKHFKRAL